MKFEKKRYKRRLREIFWQMHDILGAKCISMMEINTHKIQ
jgi:hypothetical protein